VSSLPDGQAGDARHDERLAALEGKRKGSNAGRGRSCTVLRLRERRPADERAPGVPRRLGPGPDRDRTLFPEYRNCPRGSWPSARGGVNMRALDEGARGPAVGASQDGQGEERDRRPGQSSTGRTLEASSGSIRGQEGGGGCSGGRGLVDTGDSTGHRPVPPGWAPAPDWEDSLQELHAAEGCWRTEYPVEESGPDTEVVSGQRSASGSGTTARRGPVQEGSRGAGGRGGLDGDQRGLSGRPRRRRPRRAPAGDGGPAVRRAAGGRRARAAERA